MSDRIDGYADAIITVAGAEGNLERVSNEFYSVAQAINGNDELRDTLTDIRVPVARRQQIIEDVLNGRVSSTTVGLVSMVVGAGRVGEIGDIATAVTHRAAASTGREVAQVRSAVPLSDDQQRRLAEAIKASTGKDVDVLVTVDPTVVGGIVTTVGDTVIDGSIRTRLAKLREAI